MEQTHHNLNRPPVTDLENASPREVEREIDRTRNRLESSIGELERRLTPDALIRQFAAPLQRGSREFSDNLVARVTSNPTPVVLAVAGIAWLMASDLKGSSQRSPALEYGDRNRESFGEGASSQFRSIRDSVSDRVGSMTDAAKRAEGDASRVIDSFKDQLSEGANSLSSHVEDLRSSATTSITSAQQGLARQARAGREMTNQVTDRAVNLYHEQPVVLAAIGLALGALAGALLPPTRREDKLFGDQRDQLKDRAEDALSTQYEYAKKQVSVKVGEMTDVAKEAIDKVGTNS